jgi:electron transfer flavoprotein alpha subunit
VLVAVLSEAGSRYAQGLSAADRIIVIDDPQLVAYTPGPYVAVLEEIIRAENPRAVLIGGTAIGWDVAPLVSARLKAPLVVGCTGIQVDQDGLMATAAFCGGKMMADVRVSAAPAILMALPGSFRPTTEAGQATVETRSSPAPLQPSAVVFEELILPEGGDVDITQQDVLVGVGRGIQQKDNMELAEELARALGGTVCASRPVIDQGWLPSTRQVGKSGMTVKPRCFIALGISGAPEHVEGMKDSDLIVAVNTDPNAPIFDVADYGVVADLLDLVPALTETLKVR